MSTVVIEKKISLKEGESGKFHVKPMPSHPCRVVIELKLDGSNDWVVMSGANVSGLSVPSPSSVGDFHQTGHSYGSLSLKAEGGDASGSLRFTIICEGMDLNKDDFSIVSDTGPTTKPMGRVPTNWFDLLFGGWKKFFTKFWERLWDDIIWKVTVIILLPLILLIICLILWGNKIADLFK